MSDTDKKNIQDYQLPVSYLPRRMVQVPGFRPPKIAKANRLKHPAVCSREDENEFRSAGVLLEALAIEARAWSEKLPPSFRPAIVAILHGGVQVQVRTLAQVSFDGIRIEGTMGEEIPCSLLAHQDTIQLICHAVELDEHADEEEERAKNPIGFIWADHDEEI
ncbi:MAG: hypothetical protein COA71_01730 [SAR86 cluster bacterium]|uniref:Uncharacterized protein n=1 Tax=SAR86 cluster bacterium TaxID=2030880 RepID=A0A2A5CIA7_9GAMM|nr:MAG: hypothetical protein COA71_01730 [SAR86 cluster bacterium]